VIIIATFACIGTNNLGSLCNNILKNASDFPLHFGKLNSILVDFTEVRVMMYISITSFSLFL
jgi:hypothetical protein